MIRLIAAINSKRVIGKDNDLIWDIPSDLARFRRLTRSGPVIMGRKTWESIPEVHRPLKGRLNIVVTRNPGYEATGAEVATSIEAALERARKENAPDVWVIGGGEIYTLALPYADQLDLTLINDDSDDVSWAHFPEFKEWTVVPNEDAADDGTREENGIRYEYQTLRRASTS